MPNVVGRRYTGEHEQIDGMISGNYKASRAPPISIESQLLSVGAGFVVFVVLIALLATVHSRRKRRGSTRSPLIQTQSLKSNKNGKVGVSHFRPARSPSSNLQSPGSDSSGTSPSCTPLTPYSSFGLQQQPLGYHEQETMKLESYHHHQQQQQQVLYSENRGSISLQLQYDPQNSALQVTILACHDLPEVMGNPAEGHQTSQCNLNPYVKLRVLPDNQHRVKTRVLRGTRNPFYDETFTMYGITAANNIGNYSLYIAVLASDRYSKDLILGEAVYNLAGEQTDFINNNQKLSTTLKLKARNAPDSTRRGQVLVSMAHNVYSNSINLAVLKMKDLPTDSAIGLIDPYVKVYMLVNGQRVAKQKTHVKKKTRDPVFNESFSFDLILKQNKEGKIGSQTPTPLEAVAFQLVVLNHDGVTRNEVVGQCYIDSHSQHFQQIRESSQQIAEWHTIQP